MKNQTNSGITWRLFATVTGLMALAAILPGCQTGPAAPTAADAQWDITVGGVHANTVMVAVLGPANGSATLNGDSLSAPVKLALDGAGTAHLPLSDLSPATRYTLTLTPDGGAAAIDAAFATPPQASSAAAVTLQFSADLGGQNACRDAGRGYAIFDAIATRPADAFVALGDMIYADGTCEPTGPFGNVQIPGAPQTDVRFDDRWRYNFADPAFRRLRHQRNYIATWDDHEIINDFGPQTAHRADAPSVDLLAAGRRGFLAHNPVAASPNDANRIYRQHRFGAHAELFVLDARQYRDRNDLDDTGVLPKSLLGAAQRRWLIESVATSTATWKLIASSVPIAIPTGWPQEAGRDGWASGDGADGFERELYAIFEAWARAGVRNVVFLSADVHFATGFELKPLPEAPNFVVHEWIVGPLSAGIYPNDVIDPTFSASRTYWHAPDKPPTSLDQALNFYNFGEVNIDAAGSLRFHVVNGHGQIVASQMLDPQ